jgi:sulfate/thiosulfate-binding protein
MRKRMAAILAAAMLAMGTFAGCGSVADADTVEIVNVSYDPTRELYQAYNTLFEKHWEEQTGQKVRIIQSHGGSGKQALEVANGLDADVVTLALEGDIKTISDSGLIDPGFTSEFPDDSAPYTSTIVFLVRKGNPKQIKDWDDLLRSDVSVITPNPKTSGGARWNYLAAWYYFEGQGESEEDITEHMKTLYQNVLVLDSGARGSTTTFIENGQGDVLIAWENEAFLSMQEEPGEYEIVVPSASVLCQPTVAVVDEVVDRRGSRAVAEKYLNYLYSDEAQKLAGENYYRPADQDIAKQFYTEEGTHEITEVPSDGKWMVTDVAMADISHFGGWDAVIEKYFSDGGIFDTIYERNR